MPEEGADAVMDDIDRAAAATLSVDLSGFEVSGRELRDYMVLRCLVCDQRFIVRESDDEAAREAVTHRCKARQLEMFG